MIRSRSFLLGSCYNPGEVLTRASFYLGQADALIVYGKSRSRRVLLQIPDDDPVDGSVILGRGRRVSQPSRKV